MKEEVEKKALEPRPAEAVRFCDLLESARERELCRAGYRLREQENE